MHALFLVSLIYLAGATLSFNVNRENLYNEQRIEDGLKERIRSKRAIADFGLRTLWNTFGKELCKRAATAIASNAKSLFTTIGLKFFSSSAAKAEEKIAEVVLKSESVIKQLVEEAPLPKIPRVNEANLVKAPVKEIEQIVDHEKVLDEIFEDIGTQNEAEFPDTIEQRNDVNFGNEQANDVGFPNEPANNVEFPNEIPNEVDFSIKNSNNHNQILHNLNNEYVVYNESPNSDIEFVLLPRQN